MKKITIEIILVIALLFCFVGCTKDETKEEEKNEKKIEVLDYSKDENWRVKKIVENADYDLIFF